MDDSSLCKLIREALHSPEGAEVLALAIDQLPEIKRYLGGTLLPYYDQALLTTMRDVQRNISKFPQIYRLNLETINCQNPTESNNIRKKFISWVMMILKRDCHDVRRRKAPHIHNDEIGISYIENNIPDTHLTGINSLLEKELDSIGKQIRLYIQEDPDRRLRDCYLRGRPDINCQILLQKRFLDDHPRTLENISRELQVPTQSVRSRLLRNCFPLIRAVAMSLGYEPDN